MIGGVGEMGWNEYAMLLCSVVLCRWYGQVLSEPASERASCQ